MSKKIRGSIAIIISTVVLMASPVIGATKDYETHWAKQSIERCIEKGMISGYEEGIFKPEERMSRAQFASVLVKIFGFSIKDEVVTYEDVQDAEWYATSVKAITIAGIMEGEEGKFRPHEPITKGEALDAIAAIYHIPKESMQTIDKNIVLKEPLTRAEAATMVDKMAEKVFSHKGKSSGWRIKGNVIVNTADIIIEDVIVYGDLYLTEGIGDGKITLKDTIVHGKIIVNGGGAEEIIFENVSAYEMILHKEVLRGKVAINPVLKTEVRGSVQKAGNILPGASVRLEKRVGAGGATYSRWDSDETDNVGKYKFKGMDEGYYRIYAEYRDENDIYTKTTEGFEIDSKSLEKAHVLNLTDTDKKTMVQAMITNGGQPVQGARVQVIATGEGLGYWSYTNTTNERGEVDFISGRLYPVGTQIQYKVMKEGYKTTEGTVVTKEQGINRVNILLEK